MIKQLIIFFFLGTVSLLYSQEPVFVHLTEKEGLPDKEFYDIMEDGKGFVWLCADKGLFRYDGKIFKSFSNSNQRGLSVFGVKQDHLGRVWCNNISSQFFYVNENKLELFIDLSDQLSGELVDFMLDEEYLWVFSLSKIFQIKLKTKQITTHLDGDNYGTPLKLNNSIYFHRLDSISTITPKKNIKAILATQLKNRDDDNRFILKGKSRLFSIGNAMFFTQNRYGKTAFFQFDLANKTFNSIKGLEALSDESVYEIFEKNAHEIWFATSSGVWIYNFKNNQFQLKNRYLKDKNITNIIKDKDNTHWFITLNNGIYIMPNLFIEACSISELNRNIKSLDKINDSTLVFGTNKGQLGFYNTKTDTENPITIPTKDRVSTLIYHPNKQTIFISKDISSYTYSIKSSELKKVKNFDNTKSFTVLQNDDLLCTTYNFTYIFKNADLHEKPVDIPVNKRSYDSYYKHDNQTTFIAYVDNFIAFDSVWKPTVITAKDTPIYGKSISKTQNGVVWVATFKDGIYGVKNGKVIQHYTTENGLTSDNIVKIKADDNTLWIASSNSIQVLNTITNEFKILTKTDGVVSYDISGIEFINDKAYFSYGDGMFFIDKENAFKNQHAEVNFNALEINEKTSEIIPEYNLNADQNTIKIGFNVNGFLYNQKGKYKYRLKGFNDNWLITDIGVNTVKYNSLPPGHYQFQVQPYLEHQQFTGNTKTLKFVIATPIWKRWWFILSIVLCIITFIVCFLKRLISKKEKEQQKVLEKISLEKELSALNLTALRSQMNPHFIFNALNSIQDLILKKDTDVSYDYIVLFAELIRNTLNYSSQDFIPIEKELEFLNVYLKLEKLRFGDAFCYSLTYDNQIALEVPSLLVQPFIENALLHGLLHKSGKKELCVEFVFSDVLQCIITDNGIGRVKAQKIDKRQGSVHQSFALSAIAKRLDIFKLQYNTTIGYVIEDLYENAEAIGTKVTLTMPFKKRF